MQNPCDNVTLRRVIFFCIMNTMKMNKLFFASVLLCVFFAFVSCNTTKEIPDDLTAPQLLQRGQAALDSSDYKTSEKCFLKTIEQYGDDTNTYIEAKYELAHLYIKTRDYRKAYYNLEEILELYDYAMVGDLPPAYKKLVLIEMSKIPEKKLEELKAEKNK